MHELRQIRAIFEGALERDEAHREAFVTEACGSDESLRREVLDLLSVGSQPLGYLDPPSAEDLARAFESQVALPELEGMRIAGFRMRRVIASGGMGVVFEAEQDEPRRRVAIKVLRVGLGSPTAVSRFRFESELLGRLSHPAIARVFDAGVEEIASNDDTPSSLPWYAMELIEGGRDIVSYVTEEGLARDERLQLGIVLCEALQHAHQRGVVHRDLKPDNVLVDSLGKPKIIDFGVARDVADDAVLRTQTGQVVGTLRYMSPEQIEGRRADIDARTDVYALGTLIFEILTGEHPFALEGLSPHEAARRIAETSPRPLRQVDPRCPRDLEIVLGKALEKDPERRYVSAAALGEDIERVRSGRTVHARPASWAYQARRFARRNRLLVLATAIVVLVSISAAVWSYLAAGAARRAEAEARAEQSRVSRLVERHLAASARNLREFRERLASKPGSTELGRDLLSATREDLEALRSEVGDNRHILLALADALLELGQAQGGQFGPNLGAIDEARRCFERAREIATTLQAQAPAMDARERIAIADLGIAAIECARNEFERAEALYLSGIAELEAIAGGDPLAQDLRITATQGALAALYFRSRRIAEALAIVDARHLVSAAALRAAPEDPRRLGNHAISLSQSGIGFKERGDLSRAEELIREAQDVLKRLCELEPADPRHRRIFAQNEFMLGEVLLAGKHYAAADEVVAAGISMVEQLEREDPQTVSYARMRAIAQAMRGRIAIDEAQAETALPEGRLAAWKRAEENLGAALTNLEALIDDDKIEGGELEPELQRMRRQLEQARAALR